MFVTALVRELLREDADREWVAPQASPSVPASPTGPQPRFDFVPESDAEYGAQPEACEHGGILISRALCPVHGPAAEVAPSADELDDMASEDVPAPVARAQRLAEQQARAARGERLWPEDLENMKGMGPPPDLP